MKFSNLVKPNIPALFKTAERKQKKVYFREPRCIRYKACLQKAARENACFTCTGCLLCVKVEGNLMSPDDMPGILLLLRAAFYPKAVNSKRRKKK